MVRLLLTAWILRQLFRRLFSRQAVAVSYSDQSWQRRGFHGLDVPTAVALRVSETFSSVVELGAASGDRIIAIKKSRPALRTTGMDIGSDYATDRAIDGVALRRYATSAIEPGSLVFCTGTLSYMSRTEVHELMRHVADNDCALLFFEPQPPFRTRTSVRRSSDSWYHPYDSIANDCGLTEVSDDGLPWRHTGSLKNFEEWRGRLFVRSRPRDAANGWIMLLATTTQLVGRISESEFAMVFL